MFARLFQPENLRLSKEFLVGMGFGLLMGQHLGDIERSPLKSRGFRATFGFMLTVGYEIIAAGEYHVANNIPQDEIEIRNMNAFLTRRNLALGLGYSLGLSVAMPVTNMVYQAFNLTP